MNEALLTDFEETLGLSLDAKYTSAIAPNVGKALALTIEELILAPRLSNVNESGFSMSWDFADLGKYYVYLCDKWGVTPKEEALAVTGLSAIMDKTSIW